MSWQVLAQGKTVEEFQNSQPPITELEENTPILIHIELASWAPVGILADIAGAEWWAEKVAPAGMIVDDVSGDWHSLDVRGHADIAFVLILIPCIAAVIIALAWAVTTIKISADVKERELAKIKFLEEGMKLNYSAADLSDMLAGIKTVPPDLSDFLKPLGDLGSMLIPIGLIVLGIVVLPSVLPAILPQRR